MGQGVKDWVDQKKLRSVVAPFHETQRCLEVEFAIFATHKAPVSIKYILYLPASNQFGPREFFGKQACYDISTHRRKPY